MSKKKETESELKEQIRIKCIELGFTNSGPAKNVYEYDLPFGESTEIWVDLSEGNCDASIWSLELGEYIPIRKIESTEDLENFFNAICPEKYRLPFN